MQNLPLPFLLAAAAVLVVFMVLAFRVFDGRWTAAHPLPIAPDASSAAAQR